MPKIITKKVFVPKPPKALRVAAYARVSSAKDAMRHSLSAQVSYYSEYIQSHPGWQYVGVYADEAKTGTKDGRENFQRLLADCRAGKVDMVITKSISRFARNTLTLLETVRELKGIGVDVFFEEQNIHSVSTEGELMLTVLASFAQEESLSVSENQKWRIKKNFEEGIPWNGTLLGYRLKDGRYTVYPAEAEVVKRIYAEYLSGKGTLAIAKGLNADGIPTRCGVVWKPNSVGQILRNYSYTGNLLLQTTYRDNHLTKEKLFNNGEKPKYHATDTHEAIIPMETFDAVQTEMERRSKKYRPQPGKKKKYPFTGKIICANCGKHYRRKITATGPVWICITFNSLGKSACASKQIPESVLYELTADRPTEEIKSITAENGNRLTFAYTDGNIAVKEWKDRSRSMAWTDDKKEQARQISLQRSKKNG